MIAVLSADKPPVQVGQPMGLKNRARGGAFVRCRYTVKRLEAPQKAVQAVMA